MSQGDLNIANQSGAAFRADLNNQLLALGTLQSGAAAPDPSYAYQLWADIGNGLLKQRNGANNAWVTIGTLDTTNWGLAPTVNAVFAGSAVRVSSGGTAQRPAAPSAGMLRFNSDFSVFEGYNGTSWSGVGGGARGSGGDDVFYENGQTVTTSYTLTSGKNAMTAGPVTIQSGAVVTVPTGSSWVII